MTAERQHFTDRQRSLIGNRIARGCARKGWSYYKLSDLSGVPLSTIQHILDGSTGNPGFFTIMQLCRLLDIPLDVLADQLEEEF